MSLAQPRRHALAVAAGLCAAGAAVAQTSPTPQTLPEVVVEASADASAGGLTKPFAGGQVARGGRVGLLGNQDRMDTPFSSTNYTRELIEDQQARSVADVMVNDPAVRNARGFGNFQELYVLRGFPIFSDDMAYNGLYGLLPRQYVAAELLERVEVFRGANAFLNGAAPGGSGLGGAINLLPKRAASIPQTQVTAGVESGGHVTVGADVSRRFGPDRSTGVRVNLARRDGDTAVDGESRELTVAAVGLDWRSKTVRVSADLGHQDHKLAAARPSITPLGAVPDAPDADTGFAQPWTRSNERQTFGTLRAEFDLGADTSAWVAAGARKGTEGNRLALTSIGADGTGSAYRYDNARKDSVSTGELGIRTKLRTGPVTHELAATAATFRSSFRNAYAFSNFAGFAVDINNFDPVDAPPADFFTGGALNDPKVTQRIGTRSFAIADTLVFDEGRWRVTLGARRQNIEDRTYNYNTGAQETEYDEGRTTPAFGVVWRPLKEWSFYVNVVEGLVRGDVAPLTSGTNTVTNGGQALAPYRTKQRELGAKFEIGTLGGSVALFDIEKPTGALRDNGDGTSTFVSADAQRHRGVELSVFGEPVRGLKLLGGLNVVDAEMTASGKQAIGVPKQQANIGADWSPAGLPDWSFNARIVHTSKQWADGANTNAVPAWTRLDLGARWDATVAGTPVTVRARLDNATDRGYWASAGGYPGANYLVLGNPRTLVLSAAVDF